ncbi:DUF3526 domain-containing protein [Echinicola rosea]|uniref:DUF3526 domain-containing protein n=1 Tax=Echinicola rosea TaxID=1807691 RepID=A0ABQ1V3C4_9BACT|nr:DUF3526 domain-containing protein [Echinicola rosea]GGF36832.1 hypothetical protein GCM10011339_26690 [Echinicola rosea]
MYRLIIKELFRSKVVILCMVLVAVLGILGLLIGKQFLDRQEVTTEQVADYQQEHIQRNVTYHSDDLGLLLYYIKFALINEPDKLAALSIGQSDVNPNVRQVTIRNLEGQKYDTDLVNPSSLQAGNLDLGFVIIHLFPLLIIVLTFNLLSEEREAGIWPLITVQSKSRFYYIAKKLLIRVVAVLAIYLLLFVVAIMLLQLPVNTTLSAFFLLGMGYLVFWFTLSFLVVSFGKGSSYNALTLLSLWLVLSILLPSGVNSFLTNRYPVPEALETMIDQRDGYHKKWDTNKRETMEAFYDHYPQFASYGMPPEEGFNWLWYYAMQQMGDDDAREATLAMNKKLEQRESASRMFAWVLPSMHVQLAFNQLAGTGQSDHLRFLEATDRFHERLRMDFYPKIFETQAVSSVDWESLQPKIYKKEPTVDWLAVQLPVWGGALILLAVSLIRFGRLRHREGW